MSQFDALGDERHREPPPKSAAIATPGYRVTQYESGPLGSDSVHELLHMDSPTRLAWGLLAWPVMITFAVLLASAADPHGVHVPWVIVTVAVGREPG